MDDYSQIESRYGIAIPDLYRTLQAAGHFDAQSPELYIAFTDHEWLTLEEIASYELGDWQTISKQWFVPFSISARRDEWGWRRDWASSSGEPAVVFCERGPEGYGYVPDFQAFLYRMLLEELSGTWLLESHEDENGKQQLMKSIDYICPHLPKAWASRIAELSRRPWHTDNETICVYPRSECNTIVAEDLAFDHLNEDFLQESEDEA